VSADNCVAILKTPDGQGGFEYRVAHRQAIENIYWDENSVSGNNNPEGNPIQVVSYFGKCNVLTNQDNAFHLAQGMAKEILADDFCPVLEYGIVRIDLPHPFSYYREKCHK
jgi:hypothetical protein